MHLLVFVLVTAMLGGFGYTAYLNERQLVRQEVASRLSAVAQLRVSELASWRRERLGDGQLIRLGPGRVLAAQYLRTPTDAVRRLLAEWFRGYSDHGQYDAVHLLDAQGGTRLSEPSTDGSVSRVIQSEAAAVMAEGQVRLVDFFRDERDQKVRLAVLVPIADAEQGGRMVGTVALSIDPDRYLNVYVTASPLLSRTAETALVRQRGNDIEQLVPLRFDADAALNRTTPVSAASRIVVKAATGTHGALEGTDADGRLLFGWATTVPDSPWHLLVHQDAAEGDEQVVVRLRWVMLVLVSLMAVNASVLLVGWRKQHARHLERELALSDGLSREVARLQMALRGGRHGLWEVDVVSGQVLVSPMGSNGLDLAPLPDGAELSVSLEHVHPEDRGRALGLLERMRSSEPGVYDVELRVLDKASGWRWIRLQGKVSEQGPDGRALRASGLITDITSLKTAQLRSQRYAQLYATLSYSNDAIAKCRTRTELFTRICEAGVTHGGMGLAWIGLVDEATGRVDIAAAAGAVDYLKGIGVTVDPSDVHGQGPTGTAIRENRPIWTADFVTDSMTGPWHARAAAHGWAASASLPIRKNGRPIGALMFYTRAITSFDKDDRKLLSELAANLELALDRFEQEDRQRTVEARLEEGEARYRSMFAGNTLPMLLIDPADGRIVDANLAAAEFYGWYRETLVTMTLADISTLPAEAIQANMMEVLELDLESFKVKHRLASGDIRDVEVFAGRIHVGDDARLLVTVIDVTARVAAERSIENAMREKDALLKEVHHRVKNNLQVITSLLRLEGGRSADPMVKRVMDDMQRRLIAMALLHEMLYRTGTFAHVDLSHYLGQLSNQLFHTVAQRTGLTLVVKVCSVTVDMDTAVPCGLLVNELVSNALKHAFPDGRAGEVQVTLTAGTDGGALRLIVADNGVGLPDGFDPEHHDTLGLKLVTSLARQLRGTLEFSRGPGTTVTLTFEPRVLAAPPARS